MKSEVTMPYMSDCPSCIPLVLDFPTDCVPKVIEAGRCILTGTPIPDVPCSAHCATTLLWWGESLWLKNHVHESGAQAVSKAFALNNGDLDLDAGVKELEKCCALSGAAGAPGAIDWKKVFETILFILNVIKPFIFPEPAPTPPA